MSRWKRGIEECDGRFEDVESAVIHQTVDRERYGYKVCGTVISEGYFMIRHTFSEHTCAEFVRTYDVGSSAVRVYGDVKDVAKADADLNSVVETLHERGAL